jgi:hypothetical protein
MLTPVVPSTSNINDRLQCRRHLKAEDLMIVGDSPSRRYWASIKAQNTGSAVLMVQHPIETGATKRFGNTARTRPLVTPSLPPIL